MSNEDLQLVEPSLEYREGFQALAEEYLRDGTEKQKARYRDAVTDFPSYVRRLQDESRGMDLHPGYVPATAYWLVRDGETIVAVSSLRHELTEHLEYEGGHIGYGTRPSEWRKGYGTLICAMTIEKAREMGFKRVLITCDCDNAASTRIIEKNGGKLENQVVSRETGKIKNRYWIDLCTPASGPRPEIRDALSD